MEQGTQTTFAELVRQQRGPLPGGRYRRTQEACAETVGVDVSTWRAWERGKRCPRVQEAMLFAEAFDLDEEVVFGAIAEQEHRRAQ